MLPLGNLKQALKVEVKLEKYVYKYLNILFYWKHFSAFVGLILNSMLFSYDLWVSDVVSSILAVL